MKPEDNEILTQMKAIRAKCLDCMGYQPSEVEKCPSTACTLYPYRFGKTPKGFKKTHSTEPFLERIRMGMGGPLIPKKDIK